METASVFIAVSDEGLPALGGVEVGRSGTCLARDEGMALGGGHT